MQQHPVVDKNPEINPMQRMSDHQQFVILRHQGNESAGHEDHFDLMLRLNSPSGNNPSADRLITWQIMSLPNLDEAIQQTAKRLPDHRLVYLDYEGPISGNRGHVKQVCRGRYDWVTQTDSGRALQLLSLNDVGEESETKLETNNSNDSFQIRIDSDRLKGELTFRLVKNATKESDDWTVEFRPAN